MVAIIMCPTVGDVVRCDMTYTQTAGFGGEGTVAAIQYTGFAKYRLWIKNSWNGMPICTRFQCRFQWNKPSCRYTQIDC